MISRKHSLAAALEIGRAIGESRVLTDDEVIERYGIDESEEPPRTPDAVVVVRTAREAAVTLRIASEHQVPVTPRGGGTGKSGGAVPVRGGLVLATEKLDAIEEIDPVDLVAVVQPGVVLEKLHEALHDQGLFYPPDPASLDSCCIGGNVAENAGGPRAFKYGVTSHWVLKLDVVTAGGTVLTVGHRPVKSVAGYSLAPLMCGSEGTLGLFTEVTLKLIPEPPCVSTALALFPDLVTAGRGVNAVLAAGLVPRVMELMDHTSVDTVRNSGASIPPAVQSVILLEFDGLEKAVEEQLERAGNALDAVGATEVLLASGPAQQQSLWHARRVLSEALRDSAKYKISDDISVPRSALVSTLERVEAIGKAHGLRAATYGHAGDGNLHVNFLYDDADLAANAALARADVLRLAIAAGGSISGEHGIGSVKRRFLPEELGDDVHRLSKSLKELLDPAGIMNPGKLI